MSTDIGNYNFATPNPDTASAGNGGGNGGGPGGGEMPDVSGYEWIFDGVRTGIITMYEAEIMKNQSQRNPCDMAAFLRQIAGTTVFDKVSSYSRKISEASVFLPDVIGESIAFMGHHPPGGGLSGGKRLGEYAIDSLGPERLIPANVLPGLAILNFVAGPGLGTLAMMDWIEAHMPTGQELASGQWRDVIRGGTGEQISANIFLSPMTSGPARAGAVYKGRGIRTLINNWIQYQGQNLTGTDLGTARTTLTHMVGTYRGTGPFGIWKQGDPIAPNSDWANVLEMERHVLEIEEYARNLCAEQQATQGRLMEAGLLSAEQQATDALAAEREDARRTARRNDLLVVGGLVIGAYLAVRG